MPRIFSGFPYTPSLNGHLLAIKSLQQKSSPEAILTILIEAWFILPVVDLPQLLHTSKEVGSAPKQQETKPAGSSAVTPQRICNMYA